MMDSYFEYEPGLYSDFRTFEVADDSSCDSEPTTSNYLNKQTAYDNSVLSAQKNSVVRMIFGPKCIEWN